MMKRVIRILFIAVIAMTCGFGTLFAQDFKGATVRIIVPFAPGGTSDILARLIAPHLQKSTGATVVVENKPGASANIGADLVSHAKKDGMTLLLTDMLSLAANQTLFEGKLTYSLEKDLTPVTMVVFAPYILAMHPSVPVKSVDELIKYSKANPGKLVIGSSGAGSMNHITAVQLMKGWGIDWKIVQYKGGADAIRAVTSNEAQLIINGATATQSFVTQNQMKGLGVSGVNRLSTLPDIKTWKELKFPVVDNGTWQGVMATAGSPPKTVAKLNAEIKKILAISEVKERIKGLGGEVKTNTPAEFGKWIADNKAKLQKIIKTSKISAN